MSTNATTTDTLETFIGQQPVRPIFDDWADETDDVDSLDGELTIETFIGRKRAATPSDY